MDDHTAIVDRLVGFGHELRDEGVPIGSDDTMAYCAAVAALDPGDIHDLYWAGRISLVKRREHLSTYDRAFRTYFLGQADPAPDAPTPSPTPPPSVSAVIEVPSSEPGNEPDDGEELTLGLVGSDAEILRDKSFASCSPDELRALRRIMATVRLTPPTRRTRRARPAGRRVRPDMRRMVREALRSHEIPPRLRWSGRKERTRPLVLILDVSGSMSDYSRNLLQFAYATRRAAGNVEVFCFGTRLTRVTRTLDRRRPDEAMALATSRVLDWDGGTRIGDSIDAFVKRWGRRGLSRGAIVVICSDALDRGDPAILAHAMERLSRLCHRIVWVNPHVGDDTDYQPNTLGMMVAAPFIDTITSGHNLRNLETFAAKLPGFR